MTQQPLFHEIVERHGPTVLRVCAATLGPGADAEDAWSETFLAALRGYPFDDIEDVEAWLVRVARHKSVDIVRRNRRAAPHPELVRDLEAAHDSTRSRRLGAGAVKDDDAGQALQRLFVDDVGARVDVGAWDGELWSHVGALSERQQFVVVHRYVGQWTYPEIADKLGCSTAAARRCGADAIAALRHRLIPTREDT